MKRRKKTDARKIEDALWVECKRIVRARYPHECYTCFAKNLEGANLHTGHGPWPKSALPAYLKYDLRCLRIQCFNCNINLGGMGAEFLKRMLAEDGKRYVSQLERDRQKTVKASDHYARLLNEYRAIDR